MSNLKEKDAFERFRGKIQQLCSDDILILQPLPWDLIKLAFSELLIKTNRVGLDIDTEIYLKSRKLKELIGSKATFARLYKKLSEPKELLPLNLFQEPKDEIIGKVEYYHNLEYEIRKKRYKRTYIEDTIGIEFPANNNDRYDNNRLSLFLLDFILHETQAGSGISINDSFSSDAFRSLKPTKLKINEIEVNVLHRQFPFVFNPKIPKETPLLNLLLQRSGLNITDNTKLFTFNMNASNGIVYFNFFFYKKIITDSNSGTINSVLEIDFQDSKNWECISLGIFSNKLSLYLTGLNDHCIYNRPSILEYSDVEIENINKESYNLNAEKQILNETITEDEIISFLERLTPGQISKLQRLINIIEKNKI